MSAAAGLAAAAAAQVVLGRQPTEFEGLPDKLVDGFLNLVQFLLCVNEAAGDRVLQQLIAMLLEVVNFFAGEGQCILLLLL